MAQIRLRPYQVDLVDDALANLNRHGSTLLQLPTGGGKTVIFTSIGQKYLQQGLQVLVLVHRKELLSQAAAKFQAITGVATGAIKAGIKEQPAALVQVASVQSLARRSCPWLKPQLIITDECHHSNAATYRKIYDRFPDAHHLGVSATPRRQDGQGLGDVFSSMIRGPQIRQLQSEGFLAPYRLFGAEQTISTKGVKKQCGDYSIKQLSKAAVTIMGDIVTTWEKYAGGKQTVGFCVDVQHSQAVTQLFQDAGVTAAHLDGKTPEVERDRILQDFEQGRITYLSNCGIISEGFDVPGIEAVQIMRPTASVALYLQQIGRALRPAPGKDHAIVLDHTENWLQHGLPCDSREWSLNGTEPQQDRFLQRNDATGLIEEYEPPAVDLSAQIEEISPGLKLRQEFVEAVQDAIAIQEGRGYKPGWVWFQVREMLPTLEETRWLAKRLGYHWRWALHKQAELRELAQALV